MAPRDVIPGEEYAAAIVRAIAKSRAMIFLLSSSANASPFVRRELERASHHGIPILTVRVEDVVPGDSIELFISQHQWLDVIGPPFAEHLPTLVTTASRLVARVDDKPPIELKSPVDRRSPRQRLGASIFSWSRSRWFRPLVVAVLSALSYFAVRMVFRAPDALSVAVAPADLTGDGAGSGRIGVDFAVAVTRQLAAVRSLAVRPSLTRLGPVIDLVRDARDAAASRLVLPRINVTGPTLAAEWSVVDTSRNRVLPPAGPPILAGGYSELASTVAHAIAAQLGTTYPERYDYVPNLVHDPALVQIPETARAAGALRREDLDDAVNATARIVSALPNSVAAWAVRAHALAASWEAKPAPSVRSELDRALDELDRLDPNNPYSRTYRALVQSKQGNPSGAIRGLDALLLRPDLQPAAIAWLHRLRASIRADLGDHESAWKDLVAAATADPLSAPTFAAMSRALRADGNMPGAADRARQAVELEPSSWRYRTIFATTLLDRGHLSEAVGAFHAACDLGRVQEPCALEAIALWRAGRRPESRSAAAAAAGLPTSVYGAYNLACFWADAGEPAEAIRMLGKSVELGLANRRILGESSFTSLRGMTEFKAALEIVNARLESDPPRDR